MKTILLPTDYSETARNAIQFATVLYSNEKVKYVLYHSYVIPNAGNTTLIAIDDIIRKESEEKLNKLRETLQEKNPNSLFEAVVEHNPVAYGIASVVKRYKVDIIVMGTKGATGLKEVFLGSNAVDVLNKIDIPAFIVPSETKALPVNDILFCSDYEKLKIDDTLQFLKDFILDTKAQLRVLHIKTDRDAPPKEEHIDVSHEEASFLKDLNPKYRVVVGKDVEKGINWYLKKHPEIKMLTLINHKRNFFENLFKKNRVNDIACHAKLPLLVLPEKE